MSHGGTIVVGIALKTLQEKKIIAYLYVSLLL